MSYILLINRKDFDLFLILDLLYVRIWSNLGLRPGPNSKISLVTNLTKGRQDATTKSRTQSYKINEEAQSEHGRC